MTDLDDLPISAQEHIEDVPDMTFSSSPVQYPPSSSPAPLPTAAPQQKRRLFQTLSAQQPASKRPRISEERDLERVTEQPEIIHNPFEDEDLIQQVNQPVSRTTPKLDSHQQPLARIEDIDDILSHPPLPSITLPNLGRGLTKKTVDLQTCHGQTLRLAHRNRQPLQTYEQIIADRSVTKEGRAKRAYYGIEIHTLVDEARIQSELDAAARETELQKEIEVRPSVERPIPSHGERARTLHKHQMWTEKYRAKKFTELVGDERTHRSVLKWLKAWDPVVFPGNVKSKPKRVYEDRDAAGELQHRKIMLLTGPPGLGKTTLAHVCAKQAGYEVLEINASDDRSRDVVKGRIKDALATETVRGISEPGKSRKAGRPVCVVVDEVDGVVTGSGGSGGEGGFMKALIDLVQLDQKNSLQSTNQTSTKKGKKGDRFKLLRPLILICNDIYAPSLRPLRQSSIAEIVHVRKPPIEKVISRLRTVFEKENIACDNDAVRRLCEDSWGLGSRKQNSHGTRGSGDGDIRGVLVQGEWMAHKLRLHNSDARLTRKWVEEQISHTASKGPKGLGRDGTREIVERVFIEGAGLPNLPSTMSADDARLIRQSKAAPIGVADLRKRSAINALREMIDTCGDHDRLMTDCFATYSTRVFQDDTFLSKPNQSYDWLYFHDSLSSRVHSAQEWELTPYLSTGTCAFHDLFSSTDKGTSSWHGNDHDNKNEDSEAVHPFSGPKADFTAYEAEKANRTVLTELQANFSAELLRVFRSTEDIAMELIPSLSRILAPDVKPVVVGGSAGNGGAAVASVRKESERCCVKSAVRIMSAVGVAFEHVKIESEGYGNVGISGGFALRMEPPIDILSTYQLSSATTKSTTTQQPTRYAIRQVLDQELRKEKILQASLSRQARGGGHSHNGTISSKAGFDATSNDKENVRPGTDPKPLKTKRDFFGRIIHTSIPSLDRSESLPETCKIDAATIAQSTALKGRAKISRKTSEFDDGTGQGGRIWVSFNEGFSNAVRKPITLADLMEGF